MSTFQCCIDYTKFATELKIHGSILLPPNLVFSSEEIKYLDELQSFIPEETVSDGDSGDIHDIYVRRIMTDRPGELPTKVNQPFSGQIVEILEDEKRSSIFKQIFDSDPQYIIRRCQINRMVKGSFVGIHLDAESNMSYEYSVIIQLGQEFEGGEFVVYPEHREPQIYFPTYGTVVITTCKFRHEVRKVTANERKSLVYFYSGQTGINPKISPNK